MTLPVPNTSEPARSRRALLAGAAGGLLAAVAGALGRPAPAAANHLMGFGHPNPAGTANTSLTTSSTGTALLVTQNGTGTALRGSAVGPGSIAGFFTAQNGTGISGVTGTSNKYGVYGGNDAPAFGNGAAMRADGKQNYGLIATNATHLAPTISAINTGTSGMAILARSEFFTIAGHSENATGVAGYSGGSNYGGVAGTNNSTGFGVLGRCDNGTGVLGLGGNGDGVEGQSFATLGHGVMGLNQATSGGTAVAGFALATTGTPYGVYGSAPSNGYAGYFVGNAHVLGTLSKAAGSFKIDHPLDPANRYLSHSFVESPDMKNVYDGLVTTDADGRAEVTLPGWFESLNRDFRYQLTVVGEFAQAIVAAGVRDNRFTIATDKPNTDVSWQVTGIRKDPYAEAHRIPVDERKPAGERGTYLHPTERGQPASKGLDARYPKPKPVLADTGEE